DVVLRERIFEPLGMSDTSYDVPEAKMDRLAACYQPSLRTGTLAPYDDGQKGHPSRAMNPAGGTGLFSTADDFLAFGRMMLRFGGLLTQRYGNPLGALANVDFATLAYQSLDD